MSKLIPWAYKTPGYLKHTANKKSCFHAKTRKTNSYLIAAFCCIATILTASACTISNDGTTPSTVITLPDQDDTEDTTTTTEPSEETTDPSQDEPQQDGQTDDEIGDSTDTDTSEPEAVESLAIVLAQPHPGTMRGELTSYLSEEFPYEIEPTSTRLTTRLTARFESDAEGDVAVSGHIPTENDPELAQDTEMEFRYVGDDKVYRRWSVIDSEETEHTWQSLNIVGTEDNEDAPDAQEAELLDRILCVFPFEFADNTFIQCDPYRSSLVLLESAQNAKILDVEDVRDTQTLAIGFQMPLREMSEALIESYKILAEQMIALYSTIDFDELLGDTDGDLGSPLDEDTDLMAAYTEAINSINSAITLLENADLEVHVNVDTEGRIRRIVIHIGAAFKEMLEMLESEQGIGDSEKTALEDLQYILEFYDFGADISVEAPSQEQISDSVTWPPVFNQS